MGGPLLLEVIRRCQQKEKGPTSGEVSILCYPSLAYLVIGNLVKSWRLVHV